MAQTVDIRELNVLIEQQSGFVTNLVTGMNKVINIITWIFKLHEYLSNKI